jgi:hypothetical protein
LVFASYSWQSTRWTAQGKRLIDNNRHKKHFIRTDDTIECVNGSAGA